MMPGFQPSNARHYHSSCSSRNRCTTTRALLPATGEGLHRALARRNRQLCCSAVALPFHLHRGPCYNHVGRNLPGRNQRSWPRTCIVIAWLRSLAVASIMTVKLQLSSQRSWGEEVQYHEQYLYDISPVAMHLLSPHGLPRQGFDSQVAPNHPSSHSHAETAGGIWPPRYLAVHWP